MMRALVRRRLRNVAFASASLSALAGAAAWRERSLQPSEFVTGWTLLAGLLFLAALNLRKKCPLPAIGAAATWMQAHIYVGLGSAGAYLLHAGFRVPNGAMESTLAILYGATFASGLVGLYWTRALPRRLARLSDEVIYERIPVLRGRLRDRAQTAVLTAVRTAGATTLGEFYCSRLQDYFERRRGWAYRLSPSSKLRKLLLAELTEAIRYMSDSERRTAEELFALIRKRDDLDYHEAMQWRLKWWLFVHVALTYPLLLVAGVHAWLAHVFYGGLP